MKSTTILATLLALPLFAIAAPAPVPALQPRWCHPVCCCSTGCVVGEVCDDTLIGYVTYCCHQDLETASPMEIATLYAEGQCYIQTPATGPIVT